MRFLIGLFMAFLVACTWSLESGGGGGSGAPPNPCCPDDGSWCSAQRVTNGCTTGGGVCSASIVCDDGFADCNGNTADGCETPFPSMTDCMACGVRADTCPPPGATTLYSAGGFQAQGVAVDASRVYWMSDGVLQSAPKDGSGTVTVLAAGQSSWDGGLVLDGTYLYWPWLTGEIHRIAQNGGAVEVMRSGMGAIVSNLVVYAGVAYAVVARGNDGELVDTSGHDLLATKGKQATLAVFGSRVVVSDASGTRSIRYDGTDVQPLADIGAVATTDATTIFGRSGGEVRALEWGSATAQVVLSNASVAFGNLVTAGDGTLYAPAAASLPSDELGCSFVRGTPFVAAVDETSGTLRALASSPIADGVYGGFFGPGAPTRLAVDDAWVYFVSFGGTTSPGSVFRIHR